jgi:DNA polymerase-3 subunit delta'
VVGQPAVCPDMFRNIKGQNSALQALRLAMDNNRIAQAYLFHGIDGVGKFTTALYFGMALNCFSISEFRPCGKCTSCRKFLALDHPDLLYIFPSPNLGLTLDGEITKTDYIKEYEGYIGNKVATPWEDFNFSSKLMIRRESMSWLIKRLSYSNFEAAYRICIIEDVDMMNTETSNAFLKTLEEPPDSTVIILLTNNLAQLLPTVVSRCQAIHFQPVSPSMIESVLRDSFHTPLEQARIASHIADGSVKRAIHLVHNDSSELREQAFEVFQMAYQGKDLTHYKSLQANIKNLNAEKAIEIIRHLCLAAGDLNFVTDMPEQIVNIDKREILSQARHKLAHLDEASFNARILDYALLMEDYIRKLRGNVNLQLVLLNLYLQLKRLFRP